MWDCFKLVCSTERDLMQGLPWCPWGAVGTTHRVWLCRQYHVWSYFSQGCCEIGHLQWQNSVKRSWYFSPLWPPGHWSCWATDLVITQPSVGMSHRMADVGVSWRPGQSPTVLLLWISDHSFASISLSNMRVLEVDSPTCWCGQD